MATSGPDLDHLIRTAIEQTRLLRLHYRNKLRIVEPYDYGVHNGVIKLLTWQIGGVSSGPLPNWRWMEKISGTGKFLGASGNLNVAGPFILWPDSTSPFTVRGRWNGEVNGNIWGAR